MAEKFGTWIPIDKKLPKEDRKRLRHMSENLAGRNRKQNKRKKWRMAMCVSKECRVALT